MKPSQCTETYSLHCFLELLFRQSIAAFVDNGDSIDGNVPFVTIACRSFDQYPEVSRKEFYLPILPLVTLVSCLKKQYASRELAGSPTGSLGLHDNVYFNGFPSQLT